MYRFGLRWKRWKRGRKTDIKTERGAQWRKKKD